MSARPSGSPTEIAIPGAMQLVWLKKTLPSDVMQGFAELSNIYALFKTPNSYCFEWSCES